MPNSSEHIELDRQFVELTTKDVETTDIEARLEWGLTSAHDWSTLLAEHRVVILSSAGTGKTWEISSQCRKLRDAGKSAFFLRLEDLATEWELAFEIGDSDELAEAVRSEDELWLFLDSIDEARLDDPRALDRALKRLRPKIRDNLQNVHIVLTSRMTLLHKSAAEWTSPFPGQTYPSTSVMGVPSAVNPFSTATRTWNSAT